MKRGHEPRQQDAWVLPGADGKVDFVIHCLIDGEVFRGPRFLVERCLVNIVHYTDNLQSEGRPPSSFAILWPMGSWPGKYLFTRA